MVEHLGFDFGDPVLEANPVHPVYPGLVRLRDELKAKYPDVLLTGEQWWDALAAVSPLTHDDGLYLEGWWEFFHRCCRGYAFNGRGDPSRDSTGVFEGGYAPFKMVPDSPHLIPTLIVVDGTLENAPEKVEAVMRQAEEWARQYATRQSWDELAPSPTASFANGGHDETEHYGHGSGRNPGLGRDSRGSAGPER